jgi:hypothetical protein
MKSALKPNKVVTDRCGKKVAVVLAIEDYDKLLAEAEQLDSIRAYDAAKASGEKPIPFEEATQQIERSHK